MHHQNLPFLNHCRAEIGCHNGPSFRHARRRWDPTNCIRRQPIQAAHRLLGEQNHRALRTLDHARKHQLLRLEKQLFGLGDLGAEVRSGERALLVPKQVIELQVHHVADLIDPAARLELSSDLENGAMDGQENAKQQVPKVLSVVQIEASHRQEREDFLALRWAHARQNLFFRLVQRHVFLFGSPDRAIALAECEREREIGKVFVSEKGQ